MELLFIVVMVLYAVASLLEAARYIFRVSLRPIVYLAPASLGLLAHSAFLFWRARQTHAPLSSHFDWCLVAAWLVVIVYHYTALSYPRAGAALMLLLPAWLLLLAAAGRADRQTIAVEPAVKAWGRIHEVCLLAAVVAVIVGFAIGMMYLLQSSRLKRKVVTGGWFRYPSLEWLEHTSWRLTHIAALCMALGFLSGIVLMLQNDDPGSLSFTDPLLISSGLMSIWSGVAALFSILYRPARHGRKVAYFPIVSFCGVLVMLGVLLLSPTGHGRPKPIPPTPIEDARP